ncbi:MAG: hypothetical protein IJA43_06715 [Clostridia bacterium]|nr:hypothetical protein [Clostridia bacterium]
MKNKELFSENKIKKSTIKYFIISFSVFIVILAVSSVVLFMHSLDYDISNLVDSSSTTTTAPVDENLSNVYSVNDLKGKSDLLFIIENIDGIDFICAVSTDFDNKSMRVMCVDGSENLSYEDKTLKFSSIYSEDDVPGVKKALVDNYGIETGKYIILDHDGLKDLLSLFDGFSVNVIENVNYKSHDFNLTLSSGVQELSPDMTYKYLQISENKIRESIICDIIKSVLVADYVEESEKLFTSFVNLCETDISVIDYSETVDRLSAYCYADDKFYPEIYKKGDKS